MAAERKQQGQTPTGSVPTEEREREGLSPEETVSTEAREGLSPEGSVPTEAREGLSPTGSVPIDAEAPEQTLAAELAAAQAKADEHLDDLRRLAADFDNYRKRVARDQERTIARAHERLVNELLPIVDDLERALEAADQHEEAKLEEGVKLVHRALADLLRREGLEEIPTVGGFDPHVHEALLAQPSDAEEGSVIDVVQKGYRLGEHVLRPARVVVSAGQEGEGGDGN